jgi:outer membrane protease
MNNRSMLLAVALVLLCAGGARAMHTGGGLPVATNKSVAVSVQGSMGLLNGTAQENVYTGIGGRRYHLSELDWDIRNVVLAGAQVSVVLKNTVWLNAGLWGAATKGSGQMSDWDWQLEEFGSPWTDWSLSDVDLTRAWLLDLNAAVELTRFGKLGFRGIAGYKFNTWKWQDYGIRHIYSSNPSVPGGFRNDVADDPHNTAIIYEQNFHIPYLGMGLDYTAGRWVLEAYGLYSPYIFANDRDQHLLRNLDFEETFNKGGQYYGLGLRATWLFTEHAYLSAALDGQVIPEMIGDTTVTETDTGLRSTSRNTAGVSSQSWMLSLGLGGKF